MRLFEMISLGDMLRRMGELEADALAIPLGRNAPMAIPAGAASYTGGAKNFLRKKFRSLRPQAPCAWSSPSLMVFRSRPMFI